MELQLRKWWHNLRNAPRLPGQFRQQKRDIADLRKQLSQIEKKRRRDKALYREELQKATRFEFGSYTPGNPAWREKWAASKGRRVLFFARKDYSGSLHKWATAVNEHSEYAARLVVFRPHPYGYDNDIVLPDPRYVASEVGRLVDDADVVHIKDEDGVFREGRTDIYGPVEATGKPVIFTHYGGYARKFKDDESYRKFVLGFAARVAMTPDLRYPWFGGEYIPHAVDTVRFPYVWRDGRVVGHSPSTASRKGTADFQAAVGELDLTVDLIAGVTHAECLVRKLKCSVFFDQAGRESAAVLGVDDVIGWYGNSALESAVHGIPTIAHLSEDSFARAEAAGWPIRDACAIVSTPLGPAGIRRTLEEYLALGPAGRQELSRRTRRWVEEFHSYPVIARRLADLYARFH